MGGVEEPVRTPKALAVAPGLCHSLPARAAGACCAPSTPAGTAVGVGVPAARWGHAPHRSPRVRGRAQQGWPGVVWEAVMAEGGLPSQRQPCPCSPAPQPPPSPLIPPAGCVPMAMAC